VPAYVVPYKCDGCGECIKVCPQGILHIDPINRKSFNIETDMCWECFPCVKACPQKAIEVRSYSDFAPLGGRVTCDRDTKANTITWHVRYKNGKEYTFTFPIRTTTWGSIKPPQELPPPAADALGTQLLSAEPGIFGLKDLPRPGKPLVR
jgi:adenylylsulfate reductase, subunit B